MLAGIGNAINRLSSSPIKVMVKIIANCVIYFIMVANVQKSREFLK